MPDIKPGQIIKGPRWPEPAEVKLVEEMGAYVRVAGATTHSGDHIDPPIPREELDQLEIARLEADFGAAPREVFLAP